MLAYVFWHRPAAEVDVETYESALRLFHDSLAFPSASFRLDRLPFSEANGYEDWYLVDDWSELGELNRRAIDADHRDVHDRAASGTAGGWGGVYERVRGEATIPDGTEWFEKPPGQRPDDFLSARPEQTIWRRQMVLGPAPEYCAAVPPTRTRLAL